MSKIDQNQLAQLAIDALERTAFVLADPTDSQQAEELGQIEFFSILNYGNNASGAICLGASEGFVREMASSLLGVDDSEIDPTKEGQDAINELANIMAGSVILALGGDGQYFQMNVPRTTTASELPPLSSNAVECFVESESGVLRIWWLPDSVSAAAA